MNVSQIKKETGLGKCSYAWIVNRTSCRPIRSVSYSWLTNRTLATRSSNFLNHSYDYRPNWTPFSPFTFINLLPGTCDDINHVVAQIKIAYEGLSCFYITGHGIDHDLMKNLMKCANEFFNMPADKKTSISLKKSSAYRGYIQQGTHAV